MNDGVRDDSNLPPMSLGILSERYDLLDDFGTSPLFRHFRARDMQENTLVSVKLLRSIMREYPDVFDAVKVSALTHLSLRSDHIAQLLDVGEDTEHGLFVVEQFVRGVDLGDRIQRSALPMPITIINLLLPIVAALQEAHAQGAVHGGVRPDNIIIGLDGKAVLAGWACASGLHRLAQRTSSVELAIARYAAPETSTIHSWTPSSDIYSFGVVLYEALTGELPFTGEDAVELATRHATSIPVPPSTMNPAVPKVIDNLVLQCLMKSPSERIPSASALYQQLVQIGDALRAGRSYGVTEQTTPVVASPGIPYGAMSPKAQDARFSDSWSDEMAKRRSTTVVDDDADNDVDDGRYAKANATALKQRNASIWAMLAASFVLLGSIVGVVLLIRPYLMPAEIILVPALKGKTLTEAQALADERGFKVEIVDRKNNPDVPKDVIYQVREAEGQAVRPGSVIAIWVSDGPEMVPVPDLRGKTIGQAKRALEEAGFLLGGTTKKRDFAEAGSVIDQSVVGADSAPRGATIDIVLSAGDEVIAGDQPDPSVTNPTTPGSSDAPTGQTNELPPADSENPRWFRIPYSVPDDGAEHHIRVDVEEEDENRTVYEKKHKAGEKVKVEFEVKSMKRKIRLFDNDQLKGEVE
ncbi:MAG: PASTA domain-containing protein [Armatimonadaceae bacterium]